MIELLEKKEFDKVFFIMKNSFPSDEFRFYGEQKALLDNDKYRIYVSKNNAEIIGFISVWDFDSFLFVEHFAIDREWRGRGIGREMLTMLREIYGKMICLEVELPSTETAKRRIGFYERCGLHFNEYDYIQPAMSVGKNPVPLNIMSSEKKLDENEFKAIRNTLYKEVYRIE